MMQVWQVITKVSNLFLHDLLQQATRDYTIGEGPHPSAQVAANGLGLQLSPTFKASRFDYTDDTVHFDLILVMDKFTAGDVMREVRRVCA